MALHLNATKKTQNQFQRYFTQYEPSSARGTPLPPAKSKMVPKWPTGSGKAFDPMSFDTQYFYLNSHTMMKGFDPENE